MSDPSPLGASDQACNECKRRKGKCDRLLPECSPCARNRRHCLYDRLTGRTPLTRKNLTEAEERLRRAEMRIRVAERRAFVAEEKLVALMHGTSVDDAASINPRGSLNEEASFTLPRSSLGGLDSESTTPAGFPGPSQDLHFGSSAFMDTSPLQISSVLTEGTIDQRHDLDLDSRQLHESPAGIAEDPPSENDDFSWDEISRVNSNLAAELPGSQDSSSVIKDEDVVDGMASLSVEDRRAGYLGVASGAAMLRLLLPDAEHRNPTRPRRKTHNGETVALDNKVLSHEELGLTDIDLDSAIDLYFSFYHLQYPIVHEPTFRAQYAQIIPRPNGVTFEALIYMIGAVGLFTTATDIKSNDDLKLFEAAKLHISIEVLEKGNITLVQVLVLMSNYLQKRNKPNSGYNYLGLALHMAMGLGLHKEFVNWKISPLAIETRRRIWWTLYNFYTGALITFGRPWSWPEKGVEVAMPLNIHDRDLTNASRALPQDRQAVTTYTFMLAQAKFHQLTMAIYTRVISTQYPSANELLQLDNQCLGAWLNDLGPWYAADAQIPTKFDLGHNIMFWRFRNFRILMYRPFVIRNALNTTRSPDGPSLLPPAEQTAIDRCTEDARYTIASIRSYWFNGIRNWLAAWYALYFLFQAALIPCVCLRNQPSSPSAPDWRAQLQQTVSVMVEMASINPSSVKCHSVIMRLCGSFLGPASAAPTSSSFPLEATDESPQTQISNVYSMMWPGGTPTSADILMSDPQWDTFMTSAENLDTGSGQDWDWA